MTDRALGERSAHVALAWLDARAHVALVAAADRHDAVLPGGRIAHDEGRDVDFEDVGDGTDDRLVGRRGIEAGVDGAAELGEAPEQLGTILEGLPLAAERQGDGHAVARRPSSCRGRPSSSWASPPLSMLRTPSITPSTASGTLTSLHTSAFAAA